MRWSARRRPARTVARRPVSPRRCALTSAAQAPEPQARVRPAPRSHTRSRMRSGASTCAKPILARSGNSGRAPAPGRVRPIGSAATSGTKNVACGLPMRARRRIGHRPERQVQVQRVHRPRQRDVRPVQPGRPHVHLHPPVRPARRPAGCRRRCGSPGARRPVSAASSPATQRVALPQAPASAPSGLRMRMKASAPRRRRRLDGDELVAADAGAPVRQRRRAGRREAERRRAARRTRRNRCRSHASCGRGRAWRRI